MSSTPSPAPNPGRHLAGSSSPLDLRTLTHTLLEKSWLVLLCVLLGALLAAWKIQRSPRLFTATATVQVDQEEQRVVSFEKVQQEDLRGLDILRTIENTMTSRPLLERVVLTNNLLSNPAFTGGTEAPSVEQAVSRLGKMVSVNLRRGTRLLDITTIHTDPALSAKLANSLVSLYLQQGSERYSETSETANQFLWSEAQRLKKKLEESETALQGYREETGAVAVEQDASVVTTRLKELVNQGIAAKSERMRLATEQEQIKKAGVNPAALMILPTVANDPNVVSAHASLTKMEGEVALMEQRYLPKHPKMIQAQTQLENHRQAFTNAILKVPQTAAAAYQKALLAERNIEQAVKEQEELVMKSDRLGIQYNVLLREVQSDRVLYEQVLNRLKETDLTKELENTKMRVIEPAITPPAPFSPNVRKLIIQGLIGGLLAGIALALAWNSLDNSLKTVDQAEDYLRMPVLTAIPRIKGVLTKKVPIVVQNDGHSSGAEAFRTLRTSLRMLGQEQDRRTFLFTSAVPQEGKTFTSVNYAVALAQQGLRTLLIDADLRRPAVEQAVYGARKKLPGVTDFLTGQKDFAQIQSGTDIENFVIVPAGTTAPNPAELLAQGGFDKLIETALEYYDRVVVDSAPIHAVSDTLLVLNRIQTVCLLVRADKTPRKGVLRALNLVQKAGGRIAGIVLNQVRSRKTLPGYDTYYDYSYKDKYAESGVYGAK